MRILYILTSLGIGGAERQVLGLAQRMADRGHAVALLTLLPGRSEEWEATLPVFRLDMRKSPGTLLRGLVKGRRYLSEFGPELIHSHTFPANMVARVLNLLGPPTPLVSTIHNVYEGSWLRMWAYRLTDPLSRRTTAVSTAAAERFVKLKAVPRRKCSVLTNGIDTNEFVSDPVRRTDARAAMGAESRFIWLAAGRIAPAKDYPCLLRAFSGLLSFSPDACLWIAGETIDSESIAIQTLSSQLNLGKSVRWLGLRRDMSSLLDAADAFVLSSAWEGMPLVVGEAMAMEKPVVATDVGGVRELVGEAGIIVPPSDPDALARAMLEVMMAEPAARDFLGSSARERIETRFSIEAKADEWERFYREVLA